VYRCRAGEPGIPALTLSTDLHLRDFDLQPLLPHLAAMIPQGPSTARSRIMRAIRKKDTKPEKIVRSRLHAMGYRFRLYRTDLPGSPDIVLPKARGAFRCHPRRALPVCSAAAGCA
jgi:DNA mismatch endonuclease Vsr